jgi:hypothetical protein
MSNPRDFLPSGTGFRPAGWVRPFRRSPGGRDPPGDPRVALPASVVLVQHPVCRDWLSKLDGRRSDRPRVRIGVGTVRLPRGLARTSVSAT